MHTVLHGDAREVLSALPDHCVDVVITDPPYGLGESPDPRAVLDAWLQGREFKPKGGGYQNAVWDSFVPGPAVWAEVLRVCKPGGMCIVSNATRTYHWTALAMAIAGWEVRDMVVWVYATGQVVSKGLPDGGGTGLKRSIEPHVLARAPLDGTADNTCQKWGTGSMAVYGRDYHPANFGHEDPWELRPDNPPQVFFCPKPSSRERDAGLEHWPDIIDAFDKRALGSKGRRNPRAGAGRSGVRKNPRATVKPLDLMSYWHNLLAKPGQLVLDPFCGSGTTGMAAVGHGCAFLGVERDALVRSAAQDRIFFAVQDKGVDHGS